MRDPGPPPAVKAGELLEAGLFLLAGVGVLTYAVMGDLTIATRLAFAGLGVCAVLPAAFVFSQKWRRR